MTKELLLGKPTQYIETYSPDLLYPVPRSMAREKTGILEPFSFEGVDIWNGYELSWLNLKGKPEIALVEFSFPCHSPYIVESKSFKLYLNSFNQTSFENFQAVKSTLEKDLSAVAQKPVKVVLYDPRQLTAPLISEFAGTCLDTLDIETAVYQPTPSLLKMVPEMAEEAVYSRLLKSNCLATGQPDWGTVLIRYRGRKIDHKSLLKYIISFRRHSGFAEHCVEQMYHDLMRHCHPELLTVYARYTRRGGLDINPFRSNFELPPQNIRQLRQ
jgi:7-cyano-7-deazaguanine reductase